ncbi:MULTISPECIES: putative glycolipid-binding domain-containing protein [unclassified Ruegeria]|uniref:putative glycolipid-binding domain-containing protein n=1 Tax=unclassified Ruegeria TaxID=2625375 RepID=UPI0014886918|nr:MULTISPECIES: putative glycolipid-binding domain-containing protein [unclassified Ruegeria]
MRTACILWQRLDVRGHDACRLDKLDDGWALRGATVFLEKKTATSINYEVRHDQDWKTQAVYVSGWAGETNLSIEIMREASGTWILNGSVAESVRGSIDIDLGFTPATNTTAIRRLNLEMGQKAQGVAAWLDTADWQLKPLEQYYLRRSQFSYEYGSPAHQFRSDLTTNSSGLVTDYPGFWTCEQ